MNFSKLLAYVILNVGLMSFIFISNFSFQKEYLIETNKIFNKTKEHIEIFHEEKSDILNKIEELKVLSLRVENNELLFYIFFILQLMLGIYLFRKNIQNKEELRKEKEKIEMATSVSKMGIFKWHKIERIVDFNEEMFNIFKIPNDKNITIDIWREKINKRDWKEIKRKIIKSKEKNSNFNHIIEQVNEKGRMQVIEIYGKVQLNKKNQIVEILGTIKDITEETMNRNKLVKDKITMETLNEQLTNIQEDLEQQNKEIMDLSRQKEMFLMNMSHEIRTPLNGMLGLTDILLNSNLNKEKNKEYLEMLQSSMGTLNGILNDVLDFSKLQLGKFKITKKRFNLNKLVKECENLYKTKVLQEDLDLIVEVDKNIPNYLIGDDLRINQILNNLMSNAIKFTKKGYIKLEVKTEKQTLVFKVIDTGKGIKEDLQETLFEAFTQGDNSNTKKYQGTGLGMTITKQLLGLMEGDITFTSKEGEGSIFTVKLPLEVSNNQNVEEIDLIEKVVLSSTKKVLLVEDSEVNQVVGERTLREIGFEVELANNGEEAVELFMLNQYDMVFMDLQMPVMDGYEATIKIREMCDDTPIIALSASIFESEINKCIEIGMDGHLGKPLQKHKLYEVVNRYFILEKKLVENNNLKIEIDMKHIDIESFVNQNSFETEQEVLKIYKDFYSSYNDLPNEIKLLSSSELEKKAHKIKGVGLNLKMPIITEMSRDLELRIKNNEEYEHLINNYIKGFKELLVEIKSKMLYRIKEEKKSLEEIKEITKKYINDCEEYNYLERNVLEEISEGLKLKEETKKELLEHFEMGDNPDIVILLNKELKELN